MTRRYDSAPRFKLDIWRKEGTLWHAEPDALRAVITAESVPDWEIRSRMGNGYLYLQDALDGKRIGRWAVSHIEWGILKHERVSNGPTNY